MAYRLTLARTLALGLLTACVQNFKGEPKTLVVGVESEIKSLDFRTAVDANTVHVMRLFTQGLVRINERLMPEPDLALSYRVEGAQTYFFELPRDVVFHNGQKVKCEDVRASFEQAMSPASRLRPNFVDVESVSCPEPFRFVIRLKSPRASFLAGAVPEAKILPAEMIASSAPLEHIVGSGPYRFLRKRGRDLLFERFEGYRPSPFFEHVIVRTSSDPTTRYLSLVGGDIDMLSNALSPARVLEAQRQPRLQVLRGPGSSYQYLGFNLRLPKFRDIRVRRALAIAIDRDGIIRNKLLGLARPATSVLSPNNPFHNSSLKSLPYDPELARRLLKEANAEKLEIELKSSTDRDMLSVLLVIKEAWERIGVRVTLRPYEFGTFFSDVQKGNFEMFSLRWTGVTEPDIMNKVFHSREVPPGRNRVHYVNHEVDRLLDAGMREASFEKRRQLYLRAQELIFSDLPYISLWYPDNIVVAAKELVGFTLHPGGSWMPFMKARKETSP